MLIALNVPSSLKNLTLTANCSLAIDYYKHIFGVYDRAHFVEGFDIYSAVLHAADAEKFNRKVLKRISFFSPCVAWMVPTIQPSL